MSDNKVVQVLQNGVELVNAAPAPAKFGPPIVVNALTLFGVSLDQWVLIITLIWLVLQIGGWVYDRYRRGSDEPNS